MFRIKFLLNIFSFTILFAFQNNEPNWSINPSSYQFTATLSAELYVNFNKNNKLNNKIAVFEGSEVRGLATATALNSGHRYFITIYANKQNETMSFKVYLADEDTVIDINENLVFVSNKVYGTTEKPFILNGDLNFDYSPELSPIPEQIIELGKSFKPIDLDSFLIEKDSQDVRYSALESIHLSAQINTLNILTVNPKALNWIGTDSILAHVTDQSIRKKSSSRYLKYTVIAEDHAPELSAIPDQKIGLLGKFNEINIADHLIEKDGNKVGYSLSWSPAKGTDFNPAWSVNASDFQSSMTMTIEVKLNGENIINRDSKLAIFAGNQLRGFGLPVFDANGSAIYYLTVYGNTVFEKLNFKIYDPLTDNIFPVKETVLFEPNRNHGTGSEPFKLNAGFFLLSLSSDEQVYTEIIDSTWFGSTVIKLVAEDKNTLKSLKDTSNFVFNILNDHTPLIKKIPDQHHNFREMFEPVYLKNYLDERDSHPTSWSFTGNSALSILIRNDSLILQKPSIDWTGEEVIRLSVKDQTANAFSSETKIIFSVSGLDHAPQLLPVPDFQIGINDQFPSLSLTQFLEEKDNDKLDWEASIRFLKGTETKPSWSVNPASFPQTMTVTALVRLNGELQKSPNSFLAARAGNEIRGTAGSSRINDSTSLYFLTIYGDARDTINFQYYDADTKNIIQLENELLFIANNIWGQPSEPYELKVNDFNIVIDDRVNLLIHKNQEKWTGKRNVRLIVKDRATKLSLSDTAYFNLSVLQDYSPSIKAHEQVIYRGQSFTGIDLDTMFLSPDMQTVDWQIGSSGNLSTNLNSEQYLTVNWKDDKWFGKDSLLIRVREKTVNQLSAERYFYYTRIFANTAPEILLNDTLHFNEDDSLTLNLNELVKDKESDPGKLSWSVKSLSNGLYPEIRNSNHLFIDSKENLNGSGFNIQLIVTDNGQLSDTSIVKIKIRAINDPPLWDRPAVLSFNEDDSLELNLNRYARDPDEDILSYSAWSDNPFIKFNIRDSIMKIKADKNYFANNILINLYASDPSLAKDSTFTTINIASVNDTPQILNFSPIHFNEDDSLFLNLENYASDDDHSVSYLKWSADYDNDFIDIDFDAHRLRVLARENYFISKQEVTFVLTDPMGASDSLKTYLTIQSVNDAPKLIKTFPLVRLGESVNNYYYFNLNNYIYDPDDPDLNYTVSGGTELSVDIRHDSLFFTSSSSFKNTEELVLSVSDNSGLNIQSKITVEYTKNTAPIIKDTLPDLIVQEDFNRYSLSLKNYFMDPDSDSLWYRITTSSLFKSEIRKDSLIFYSKKNKYGKESIRIEADDRKGRLVKDFFTITILPINDGPELKLILPEFSITPGAERAFYAKLNDFFTDPENDLLSYKAKKTKNIEPVLVNDSLFLNTSLNFLSYETITLTAYDPDSAFVSASLKVNFKANEEPKLVKKLADLDLDENFGTYQYEFLNSFFVDPDKQDLKFRYSGNKYCNLQIDSITSRVSIESIYQAFGRDTVIFTGEDPFGKFVSDTIVITIIGIDDPLLVVKPIRDTTIIEDSGLLTYSLAPVFLDPDSNPVQISIASIDPGFFTWIFKNDSLFLNPLKNVHGRTSIIVSGKSTSFVKRDTAIINITAVDDPPVLVNPVSSIELKQYDKNFKIGLKGRLKDPDNTASDMTYFIKENVNTSLITARIVSDTLVVNTIEDNYGDGDLILEYKSNNLSVIDTVEVRIKDVFKPELQLSVQFSSEKSLSNRLRFYLKSNEKLLSNPLLNINSAGLKMDSFDIERNLFVKDYVVDHEGKNIFKARGTDRSSNKASDSLEMIINYIKPGEKREFEVNEAFIINISPETFREASYLYFRELEPLDYPSELKSLSSVLHFQTMSEIKGEILIKFKIEKQAYSYKEKQKIGLYILNDDKKWQFLNGRGKGNYLTARIKKSGKYRIFYDKNRISVPESYKLHQNYPNPFNPTTRISYDLAKSGNVSINVYNILGQLIKTLQSGYLNAGYHSIHWDGRNSSGRKVSSGIYFYRIDAGRFIQSKKMILIK